MANPSILMSDNESVMSTPKKEDKSSNAAKPDSTGDSKAIAAVKEEYDMYKKETLENMKYVM